MKIRPPAARKAQYNLAENRFFTQTFQMDTACKHPKVRVVAREEDVEYVECLDCGQVFDSNEYRDMEIEEAVSREAEDDK